MAEEQNSADATIAPLQGEALHLGTLVPPKVTNANRPIHGSLFQFKLTEIALIRGIGAGFPFHLGTEIQEFGKFDDLVFKYQVTTGDQRQQWRYKFVQAKHKLDEGNCKITSQELRSRDNGNFSIAKYFKSYRNDIINESEGRCPEAIDDVVICTNINFNENDLNRNGIELVPHNDPSDNIFSFDKLPGGKVPLRYKLKNTEVVREILKENCPIFYLAKKLMESKTGDNRFDLTHEIFQKYLPALLHENVIHLQSKSFHFNFIYGTNLSRSANELRHILRDFSQRNHWERDWRKFTFHGKFWPTTLGSQLLPKPNYVMDTEIDSFLDKFVFAVNTPNEVELDTIMKRELGNYYNLLVSDIQSNIFFNKMLDWFKNPESRWMTSDEGLRMLEEGRNKIDLMRSQITISYQNPINKIVEFKEEVIDETAGKLKPFLTSNNDEKINYISTDWPDFTAVKVVSAIKTLADYKCSDSYLIVSSKCFENLDEREQLTKTFGNENAHHLLIVVCAEEEFNFDRYADFIPANKEKKKMLLIVKRGITLVNLHLLIYDDAISYGQLREKSQDAILSKKVSFQGQDLPVRDLIGPANHENVLHFSCMSEILSEKKIVVPSSNSIRGEQNIYIKRHLTLPFRLDEKFVDKLSKELNCSVNKLQKQMRVGREGNIEWITEDQQKKSEIWNKMRQLSATNGKQSTASPSPVISDDELILDPTANGKAVIISGVAGTGKTTILSYFYREIKKAKADHWVIRVNLTDNFKALSEFSANVTSLSNAINFFTDNLPAIVNNSWFARSLLRHRLETSDRIVLMLDGFDEIGGQLQEKVIRLLNIIQTKVARLFITTRNYFNGKLENQLFQFAYTLENFNKHAQADYLNDYWITNLKKQLTDGQELSTQDQDLTRTFAASLVKRASETLDGEEISIIGIPLQCRIVAECFQSELQRIIQNNRDEIVEEETQILADQKFDLLSMYRRLMETKRQVFLREKANNASASNQIVDYAVECLIKKIESHLNQLAIETMFRDPEKVNLLSPPLLPYQTKIEKVGEEKFVNELGLKFGLTLQSGENMEVQFWHRSFAEYLVAKYFYEGFLLEDESHNGILDKEPVRDLIFQVMSEREHDHYDGIKVFFDSMLKELVQDDDNWREIVDQRLINRLPGRLKQYANFTINHHNCRPLGDAIDRQYTNIFKFICDCFDVMFDSTKVRQILNSVLEYTSPRTFADGIWKGHSKRNTALASFYDQKYQVFQRYIGYYMDHAERDVVKHILEDMLYSPIYLRNDVLDETYPEWLQENKLKVMKLILDFLVKHRATLKPIMRASTRDYEKPEDVLYFLIFNECYHSQLEQWIELFEFVYPEDNAFVKLFKDTVSIIRRRFGEIELDRQWVEGRIGNTLKILRDTGRNKVLEEIARLVLIREPQAFRQFYGHFLEKDEMEMTPATIHLLLVKDPYGMTRLHRAVFYEDTETVDRLLDCLSQSLSQATTSTAEQVMNNVMLLDDEGFTPFYVAAAYLHEELCIKILAFFKNVLTTDQLQTHLTAEKMKLVYGVLWDAVTFHKIQMFTTILTSVKHVLGQNYLLEMLSSKIADEYGSKTVFKACREKVLFKAMTDIVLKDDDNGFHQLNDLFFKDDDSILSLEYVDEETFKQMLAVIGSDNWCLKLLRHDLCTAFYLLSSPPCELLRQFQQDQLLNLLKLITTTSRCTQRRIQQSYWNRLLLNVKWWKPDFEKPMDDWTLMEVLTHFLNHTFGNVQENYIIELFFDDKGIELITRSLLQYGKNSLANGIFKHLTEEIRKYKDIKRHLMGKMAKIIRDVMKPIIHFSIDDNAEWSRIKVLDFVMDHAELTNANGDCSELSTLINTVLIKYNNNVIKKASIWGEYFRHFDDEQRIGNPTYRLKIWTDNVNERSARVCAFLKCVSEKLGSSKVKKLLTHTHGRYAYDISHVSCNATLIISLVNLKGHKSFVEAMLTHLNEEDRIQVRLLLGRDQTDDQIHSASRDELAVESNDDSSN